ncbi:MAG TPA: ferredoxin [Treponema sp.]|nr:ferredoxin [Treponema sp.]
MKKILVSILAGMLVSGMGIAKDNPLSVSYKTHETADKNAPVVYFTRNITPENLLKVYQTTGWRPEGKVGVKISTGEPPASNYLRPALIKNLVQSVNGTIVECNTAYGGSRSSAAMHYQVVKDHGFLDIAPFDLLDEDSAVSIPVNGGTRLKEDFVGSHFKNYGSYIVLSHFKGHAMGGFGGAIKNLSIGFASGTSGKISGKVWIHTAGKSKTNWLTGNNQQGFLEGMAEAAKAVDDYMGGNIVYINVMNRLSVDCDCDGNPAEPDMHDVGILASTDPLAIDQACIDLVYSAPDSGSLIERIESRGGLTQLEHGAAIGLGSGSRNYRLVKID